MGEHSVGTPQQWLADAFGITFSVAVALIAVCADTGAPAPADSTRPRGHRGSGHRAKGGRMNAAVGASLTDWLHMLHPARASKRDVLADAEPRRPRG